MGSEYERDREKGTLEISQTQLIRNVVEYFGITKNSPVPPSPSLDLRHVRGEDPAVDVSYREMVGSLMWIAIRRGRISPTQYGLLHGCRMILRRYVKAARKIIEYLSATAHLRLTFRNDSTKL